MSLVADAIQSNNNAKQRNAEATAEAIKQATQAIGRSTRMGKTSKADADLLAALIGDGSLTERDAVQIERDCRQLWEAFDLFQQEAKIAEDFRRISREHRELQERNRVEWGKAVHRFRDAQNKNSAVQSAKHTVGSLRSKLSVLFSDDGTIIDPAQKSK